MAKFPLVVPKRTTTRLGGEKSAKDTFNVQMDKQSIADIEQWGENLLMDALVEQDRIKNKPTLIVIDKSKNKPIQAFKKRGEINFGGEMQRAMIRIVEIELGKAINRALEIDTGKLEDIMVTWEWYFFDESGESKNVNPMSVKTLSGKQRLALIPNINYAAYANQVAYRERGIGFLGDAAKRLRRKRQFKTGFSVYAQIFQGDGDPIPSLFIRSVR